MSIVERIQVYNEMIVILVYDDGYDLTGLLAFLSFKSCRGWQYHDEPSIPFANQSHQGLQINAIILKYYGKQ